MPEFSPVVLPFNDETAASFAAQNMMPPTRSLMAAMIDFSCSIPPQIQFAEALPAAARFLICEPMQARL